MSDKTYTRKIYHKQGGDEMVVASGGKLTIEDGGALNMESGADISIVSGGDVDIATGAAVNVQTGGEVIVETGGQITVQSGGELEVESGGNVQIEGGGQITIQNTAELEIESGGNVIVEGGGQITIQNTAELEIESGGKISMESGSILELLSGFNFYIGSNTYTVGIRDLLVGLFNNNRMASYAIASNSVAVGVLIPSVIYNYAKFHKIIAASNIAAGVLWLASAPSVGMEMIIQIDVSAGSTTNLGQSTAVVISCDAGRIMVPVTYASNSRMTLTNSSNSTAQVRLVCLKDGEWAVVGVSSATAVTFT
jgi:hypothetical protein